MGDTGFALTCPPACECDAERERATGLERFRGAAQRAGDRAPSEAQGQASRGPMVEARPPPRTLGCSGTPRCLDLGSLPCSWEPGVAGVVLGGAPRGSLSSPSHPPCVCFGTVTRDSLWEEACVHFVLCTQLCSLLLSRWNQKGWKRGKRLRGLAARLAQALLPWADHRGVRASERQVWCAGDRTLALLSFLPQDSFLPLLPFPLPSEALRREWERLVGPGVRLIPSAPEELASPALGWERR